jgi:hypothetical protein
MFYCLAPCHFSSLSKTVKTCPDSIMIIRSSKHETWPVIIHREIMNERKSIFPGHFNIEKVRSGSIFFYTVKDELPEEADYISLKH